jgi:RNA polymerase sigma-70 factor (ECF subfamily)
VVASQDTAAFGELIRRHQSQVRNFLRKLTRDETLADDLAQDCFLHVWDKIHTFSGSGSFIGWMLKVAYTTFLQSKRKSKRYREIVEQAGHEADRVPRTVQDAPENELDLETLMAALNEQERVIMISEATELPAGTVKSIIHRAKEKIRTQFEIENHQYG